ncbi:MAG TPA: hypothetical protein VKC57_07285, partial [Ktedonobacterales bacterium]|nr:hypothetical protein [Ktedonobacterales bacterium]
AQSIDATSAPIFEAVFIWLISAAQEDSGRLAPPCSRRAIGQRDQIGRVRRQGRGAVQRFNNAVQLFDSAVTSCSRTGQRTTPA